MSTFRAQPRPATAIPARARHNSGLGISGRHHDLRRLPKGGRARDGKHQRVHRATPEAAGQPRQVLGCPAFKATLLGFGFLKRKGEIKIRIDPEARKRTRDRLREITSRRRGISMRRRIREINRFTVGWTAYFSLADTPRPFSDLDEWLRRRLRQVRWKEWKRYRTRRRNLIALGIPEQSAREWAGSRKGYWRIGGSAPLQRALPKAYWRDLGVRDSLIPTAVSGMRRKPPDADPHVRWCEGSGGDSPAPTRIGDR
jgi:hypothetical protein